MEFELKYNNETIEDNIDRKVYFPSFVTGVHNWLHIIALCAVYVLIMLILSKSKFHSQFMWSSRVKTIFGMLFRIGEMYFGKYLGFKVCDNYGSRILLEQIYGYMVMFYLAYITLYLTYAESYLYLIKVAPAPIEHLTIHHRRDRTRRR